MSTAQTETLPIVAEYVIPSELASLDKTGFLTGLTEAASADPDNAADIVRAALQFRLREIQQTPGLATEIVMAILAGLPPQGLTPDAIAYILDAAVSVLKSLPADLTNVAPDVVRAVMASLPPEIGEAVKNLILQGPEGALRDQITYIFTVLPTGVSDERVSSPSDDKKDKKEKKSKEDEKTDEPPVTPVVPTD